MLILSRKVEEAILIGDEVKVIVLSVKGRQVRLGIEAPSDVSVNREEIHKKIKAALKSEQESGQVKTSD